MKPGFIHDYLTNSKYSITRHFGYLLASIGMLILWSIMLLVTVFASMLWLTIEKGSFTLCWKEFYKFTLIFWK